MFVIATYGQYLTPAQFHAPYDPDAASVKAVKQWLRCEGLKVTGAEAHNRYLTATGTAAQAEAAFATTLHEYRKGSDTFQAPTQTATVPDSVAASILAVSGLATPQRMLAPKAAIPPPAGFVNAQPWASDPYTTSVGGTSTAIAQDGTRTDTGWGTNKYTLSSDGRSWTPAGFLYGAGGGYSKLFKRPNDQNRTVPAGAPPGRTSPRTRTRPPACWWARRRRSRTACATASTGRPRAPSRA
jgi:subtilase family serine protease